MKYYIYPLRFLTPVHFGNVSSGGGLEKVTLTYSSDTLFSAICSELASQPAVLQQIKEAVEKRTLVLSGLFPYFATKKELDVNDTLRMYKSDDIRMYNFDCITDTIVEVITTCNTYTLLTVHLL